IPVRRLWKDGIFLTADGYSRTWRFSDINYSAAGEEDKESMFRSYCELLNSLDPNARTKITIYDRRIRRSDFEDSVLMKEKGDGLDGYRREYNGILLSGATESSGIMQEKFITVTVRKKDIEEARAYFARTEAELAAKFSSLGSRMTPVDAGEKIRLLHDVYRGSEESVPFDLDEAVRLGKDFRDYISPDSVEISSSGIKLGERYACVLYLKHYASYIKDSMIKELTDISPGLMLSIDMISIPTDEAIKEVENRLLGIETNITAWQRKQNSSSNFSALVPYDMELQRQETKEFLDDLSTRDQRMMMGLVTVMVTADTAAELEELVDTVKSVGRSNMCQLSVLKFQQEDALNTVLPIGTARIEAYRTLLTESLAALMPFKVQEIMDRGGIYFGVNAISRNLILCNREKLMNQSAFLLGVPGSGKSFCAKEMIMFLFLNTDDDILICDPEGEYAALAEAAGDDAVSVKISAEGDDRLNPMYLESGYGDRDPVVIKSEFIMSLIERMENGPIGPKHKSVIDRCIASVYRDSGKKGTVPTLTDLREKLMQQKEPEAAEIALSLELYTTGSLNIFGGESNVDLDRRMVVFDIHELGENLKPTGLLVITDTMLNRVSYNWKQGKRTHVFIDEFHVVFSNEHSAQFFSSAWRQFRKRNAYPTAITQNVDYVLDSVQARTMLSNSEFIVMLSQASSDREKLAKLLSISDEQLSYIKNAEPGCGLIRYGGALVPFINRFPRDTELYELMTTTPGEGKFSIGQIRNDAVT
ncbi:MAG: ATP-binding protein, partial [Oscillospiraceae bacterium]|nr:ATP-binding protein [Oscillospiraceae bacterium]